MLPLWGFFRRAVMVVVWGSRVRCTGIGVGPQRLTVQGQAEARIIGERIYISFDWDHVARKGLIDARREGPQRLVGPYINLSNPAITRPWIGRIVSDPKNRRELASRYNWISADRE